MLTPDARTVLLEDLRAPDGYTLDHAVTTTFTLDLTAAMLPPFAFADIGIGSSRPDPISMLQSLRRAGSKVDIFCQAGAIGVPRSADLVAFLEPMVHQVVPPTGGLFHPKCWFLRFASPDREPRHQPAHAAQLLHLGLRTPGARVGHHEHRVDVGVLAFDQDARLGDLAHHRVGDLVRGLGPGVDDLVVLLALGDQAVEILLLELLHLILDLLDDGPFVVRDHHVVLAERDAGAERLAEAHAHDLVAEDHRFLLAAVAVDGVDDVLDVLLAQQAVDQLERGLGVLGQQRAEALHLAEHAKLAREVQKVVDKYKAAGKAAEKAFQDSTGKVGESQALKAHMRELDKLQRAYDPVYTATKRYEGEVEKLNRALQIGAITQGKYADSIKQAQVELGRASGVIQDTGNKARGFGGQMSNVGFQIGDFATQVGAGTSATQALGQQLPQLLGAFGTFGALAGAAAAVMIPLGSALVKTAFDSETLEERMKALSSSTDAMQEAAKAAATPIADLEAKYGDLADEIARAYAPFAPGRLQVFTSSPDSARVSLEAFGFQTEVDTYLVAGLIRELRERPRSTRFDDVTLAPISASAASRLAERVHDDLAEQNPETRLWSTPQTPEEFDEHAAAGTLFGIHLAGRLVGIIAAFRWNAHGMTGFTVAENVIDAPHRGQKLAPAAMQHLFEMLPAADGDVLWGTIHPDNQPSLRNALGVGREIVGAHLWVTPAGWPGW